MAGVHLHIFLCNALQAQNSWYKVAMNFGFPIICSIMIWDVPVQCKVRDQSYLNSSFISVVPSHLKCILDQREILPSSKTLENKFV
jgi:hypothetical protein